jgi:acetyl esterase
VADDLRTAGEAFGDQLVAAGVDVRLVLAEGLLHAFLNLSADVEPVERVLELMAATVRGGVPSAITTTP